VLFDHGNAQLMSAQRAGKAQPNWTGPYDNDICLHNP